MVYIPAPNNNNTNEKAQHGFVYDEIKKKWVLEQKNVSFSTTNNQTDDTSVLMTPPRKLQRSRTDDSCITGFTEFSYDDVATREVIQPTCPSTPQEEGVEVDILQNGMGRYTDSNPMDDSSEFIPNTNVMDDESTMFGSVLGDADTTFMSIVPPPPPPPPQMSTYDRSVSPDTSMITNVTLEPGIIQRVPVVHEELPFDEDIPFDERPKASSGGRSKPILSPRLYSNNTTKHTTTTNTMADDGSESDGSAESSHVLNDLNKLSKFMTERKRSLKVSRSNSAHGSKRQQQKHRVSAEYNRNKSLP